MTDVTDLPMINSFGCDDHNLIDIQGLEFALSEVRNNFFKPVIVARHSSGFDIRFNPIHFYYRFARAGFETMLDSMTTKAHQETFHIFGDEDLIERAVEQSEVVEEQQNYWLNAIMERLENQMPSFHGLYSDKYIEQLKAAFAKKDAELNFNTLDNYEYYEQYLDIAYNALNTVILGIVEEFVDDSIKNLESQLNKIAKEFDLTISG